MSHRFQCRCGQLQGLLEQPGRSARAVCYCLDCQTYAHLLGEPQSVLDPLGGTDVVAMAATQVRFTAGTQALACLSLSPRGLLRWYASCCHTPIANTPRNWKLPYVSLPYASLSRADAAARDLPAVRMHVNTKSAHGPTPRHEGMGAIARFLGLVARLSTARVAGRYKPTPFFDGAGAPVSRVEVPPRDKVEAARAAARSGLGP